MSTCTTSRAVVLGVLTSLGSWCTWPAAAPCAPQTASPVSAPQGAPVLADLPATGAAGGDTFYRLPIEKLSFLDGGLPSGTSATFSQWDFFQQAPAAYAVLDGPGEAIVIPVDIDGPRKPYETPGKHWMLSARAPEGVALTGRLFLPRSDEHGFSERRSGMAIARFGIPAQEAHADGGADFWRDEAQQLEALRRRRVPGGAWFRHQAVHAERMAGDAHAGASETGLPRAARPSSDELQDAFDMFSGSRALAENLALEKTLTPDPARGAGTVDPATIAGITIAPIDWAPLLAAAPPALDPLASRLPADQYALLFPSFDALVAVLDEAEANGTPLVEALESRSVDSGTRPRLEHQMCLSLDVLSRALGGRLVKSVAITGSDFDLRLGSDVAVLLQSDDATALEALLRARQLAALSSTPCAVASSGDTGHIAWSAVRSPDRTLCSYVATSGDVVLVTNSPAQLERLEAVRDGTSATLASQPEYTFFRQRHVRGDAGESALLVLTDATIRRLGGPRWRILQSRRTRALALLAEQAAVAIDASAAMPPAATTATTAPAGPVTAAIASEPSLAAYGTLAFLTPIAELPFLSATPAESEAYANFRTDYQKGWRRYFDPAAVRLSLGPTTLSADLTVMPLLIESDYRDLVDIAKGAAIGEHDGDRHDGTLLHVAFAINPAAKALDDVRSFVAAGADDASADPLGWMGSSIGLWIDDDPLWKELAAADDTGAFLADHSASMPVVAFVGVKDQAAAAALIAARMADFSREIAGLPAPETVAYRGTNYVKVVLDDPATDRHVHVQSAVFYALTADVLLISMNEAALLRALDRRWLRAQDAAAAAAGAPAWSGRSADLHVTRAALDVALIGSLDDALRGRCFANLPILNEWHRLFPGEDPVAAHARLWHERLLCPGGGHYAWNEEWHTMACTACGHPGAPAKHPPRPPVLATFEAIDFGLTFENGGLRARVALQRSPR